MMIMLKCDVGTRKPAVVGLVLVTTVTTAATRPVFVPISAHGCVLLTFFHRVVITIITCYNINV